MLGSHRLIRKLGEGGMGVVYLAEHTLLGRRAAVKVLVPAQSARREAVERFFQEARAAAAIADPGIVQVYDFGIDQGRAYLVMELLQGESLHARLLRLGRLPVVEALRIVRQAASSLAAVHAQGIVHRDLKPENIFLVRDLEVAGGERVKLLDFGIAKLAGEDASDRSRRSRERGGQSPSGDRPGSPVGTPSYMAPEQCRGADVDLRADVYALGCVLFHLLTGRPPFDAPAADVIAMHLTATPAAPSTLAPGIPAAVDALVQRCLARSPRKRFADMDELVLAVTAIMPDLAPARPRLDPSSDGTPAVAFDEGSGPMRTTLGGSVGPVRVARRRRRTPWIELAALVIAGLAGGAFAASRLLAGDGGPRVAPVPAAASDTAGARASLPPPT